MTSPSRSWHAYADPDDPHNPLPGLVERLLDLVLTDVRAGRSAQLTVRTTTPAEPASVYAEAEHPAWTNDSTEEGRTVSTSAALTDGGTATLAVRGELVDDEPTQAQLRRFIRPLVACVDLETRLNRRTGRAREAVAEIERRAITDLATGIVMAHRDCDPVTARQRLTAWSARNGHDLQTLSAVRILELLTADPA